MAKADRRVRKTKAQLAAGLAVLMKEKSIDSITVKELVDWADINRSTFYLHYTDIHNLLEYIEEDLFCQIHTAVKQHPILPYSENTFPFVENIIRILENNKDICIALLGPHGDMNFVHRIEQLIGENCIKSISHLYPRSKEDLKYYYSFCLSGCLGLIKNWLAESSPKSPEHMAKLTYDMVNYAMRAFYDNAGR